MKKKFGRERQNERQIAKERVRETKKKEREGKK